MCTSGLKEELWLLGRDVVSDPSDPAPSCSSAAGILGPKPCGFPGHTYLISLPGTSQREGLVERHSEGGACHCVPQPILQRTWSISPRSFIIRPLAPPAAQPSATTSVLQDFSPLWSCSYPFGWTARLLTLLMNSCPIIL